MNNDLKAEISNINIERKYCTDCGEKSCTTEGCSRFLTEQFERRMKREQQYCFGCPDINLPESSWEQTCPACGLRTW